VLVDGTEPLVLADGTKIDPEDGTVVQEPYLVPVPNTEEIKREIVASRKRIADLPVPPDQMNTLSVIISYSLFGITDEDISNTLFIPLKQLQTIKSSDDYKGLNATFLKNIVESDLSNVRGLFVQKSHTAAQTMFDLLGSNNEATRGSAAKDILDRAGQRPVDVVEHRMKMEGGLTIEYVEKKDDLPTIDVDF
tara:strand:+ start:79 stop:657 length:579 start_codon:yes stop_codon:yes gene_type:complete